MIANDYKTSSLQSRKQYLSLILNINGPNHLTWIIKIWRFGKVVITCYSGEEFDKSWKDNLSHFIIFNLKSMKEKEELRR
jgi:hypothetical protein